MRGSGGLKGYFIRKIRIVWGLALESFINVNLHVLFFFCVIKLAFVVYLFGYLIAFMTHMQNSVFGRSGLVDVSVSFLTYFRIFPVTYSYLYTYIYEFTFI